MDSIHGLQGQVRGHGERLDQALGGDRVSDSRSSMTVQVPLVRRLWWFRSGTTV